MFIDEANGAELLSPADVVLDALDTMYSRRSNPFTGGGFMRPQDRPLWERSKLPDKGIELIASASAGGGGA